MSFTTVSDAFGAARIHSPSKLGDQVMIRSIILSVTFGTAIAFTQICLAQQSGYSIRNPVVGSDGTLNRGNPRVGEGAGSFHSRRDSGVSHQGVDIQAPYSAQVVAPQGGLVTRVRVTEPNPWSDAANPNLGRRAAAGNQVVLAHPDGTTTHYYHVQGQGLPSPGQWLDQGMPTARVGTSGNVPPLAQTHLHFEVRRNGVAIRPDLQSENGFRPRQSIIYDENAPRNQGPVDVASRNDAPVLAPTYTPAIQSRRAGESAGTAAVNFGF